MKGPKSRKEKYAEGGEKRVTYDKTSECIFIEQPKLLQLTNSCITLPLSMRLNAAFVSSAIIYNQSIKVFRSYFFMMKSL